MFRGGGGGGRCGGFGGRGGMFEDAFGQSNARINSNVVIFFPSFHIFYYYEYFINLLTYNAAYQSY
jgi:hypothetical protein